MLGAKFFLLKKLESSMLGQPCLVECFFVAAKAVSCVKVFTIWPANGTVRDRNYLL